MKKGILTRKIIKLNLSVKYSHFKLCPYAIWNFQILKFYIEVSEDLHKQDVEYQKYFFIFHLSISSKFNSGRHIPRQKKHIFYKTSQLQIKNVLVSCNSVWLYNRKYTNKLHGNISHLDIKCLNSDEGESSC